MSEDHWLNAFCRWEDAERPTFYDGQGGQVPATGAHCSRLLLESSTAVALDYLRLEQGAMRLCLES